MLVNFPQINNTYKKANLTRKNTNSCTNRNVSFKGTDANLSALKLLKCILTRKMPGLNISHIFREPQTFEELAEIIPHQFPHGANIKCYASSDCSEPVTMALKLIEKLGRDEAKKYKIQAYDIDGSVLRNPKRGRINLSSEEVKLFEENTNLRLNDYFVDTGRVIHPESKERSFTDEILLTNVDRRQYKMSKELRSQFTEIKKGDIFNYRADDKPEVVFFRNAWIYLAPPQVQRLAETLSEKMKPGSLLVIGHEELCMRSHPYAPPDIPMLLSEKNFVPLNPNMTIYQKV